MRGLGTTFVITGLMGIAFMSFSGINLGTGEEPDAPVKTAVLNDPDDPDANANND